MYIVVMVIYDWLWKHLGRKYMARTHLHFIIFIGGGDGGLAILMWLVSFLNLIEWLRFSL